MPSKSGLPHNQLLTTHPLWYKEEDPERNASAAQRFPKLLNCHRFAQIRINQDDYYFGFNIDRQLIFRRVGLMDIEDQGFIARKILGQTWQQKVRRFQKLVEQIGRPGFVFLKDDCGYYRYIQLRPRKQSDESDAYFTTDSPAVSVNP